MKLPASPPPGPFRRSFWRSPIRGPWLTSVLGLVLLASIPVVFVTGLLSYAAYNPDLSPVNDLTPGKGLLGFYLFSWPTHPVWLYRLSQGVHVTLGLALESILLFKLWSVLPKLFEWPPLRSPAQRPPARPPQALVARPPAAVPFPRRSRQFAGTGRARRCGRGPSVAWA